MSRPHEGQTATIIRIVGPDDTATALGSGDVDVLATPRLVAWLEAATVSLSGSTSETTSVGSRVEVDHLAPSPIGTEVAVRAVLEHIDGRRLSFAAEAAHTDGNVVARARIVRVVVDRRRFTPQL